MARSSTKGNEKAQGRAKVQAKAREKVRVPNPAGFPPLKHLHSYCTCGHIRLTHVGALSHGFCAFSGCKCRKFTWARDTAEPSPTSVEDLGPCDDCGKPAGIRICTGCYPTPRDTLNVRALVAERDALRAALLGVSPWKLQDCWCRNADHGGNKPHTKPCRVARAVLGRTP